MALTKWPLLPTLGELGFVDEVFSFLLFSSQPSTLAHACANVLTKVCTVSLNMASDSDGAAARLDVAHPSEEVEDVQPGPSASSVAPRASVIVVQPAPPSETLHRDPAEVVNVEEEESRESLPESGSASPVFLSSVRRRRPRGNLTQRDAFLKRYSLIFCPCR